MITTTKVFGIFFSLISLVLRKRNWIPCWRELVARAYYNKSVSLIPYQLLSPYLRNECLNSLVNFFSLKTFTPYLPLKFANLLIC